MAASCTFPPGSMCHGWARLTPAGSSPGGHPGVPCSRGPQLPAPAPGPLSTCGKSGAQRRPLRLSRCSEACAGGDAGPVQVIRQS